MCALSWAFLITQLSGVSASDWEVPIRDLWSFEQITLLGFSTELECSDGRHAAGRQVGEEGIGSDS